MKSKSYVRLDFKKIWLRNGIYEGTKSNTMDAAEYEKYTKLKVPYTFEELYYSIMIQSGMEQGQSTLLPHSLNKFLVEHELVKLMLEQSDFGRLPSYDISFSKGVYKTAICKLLKKYETFRQFLDCGDFDYSLLPDVIEVLDGKVILKRHFLLLQELYMLLTKKEAEGLLHIVIGAPGTGKTQYVSDSICKLLKDSKDHVKIITLSNLAGNNMKSRLTRDNVKNVVCSSYAREHFVGDNEYYKAIIFEEASMLTMTEVPIMIAAIRNAKHCYIAGDCNQLPGFLGMGNILYGLTSEFGIEKKLVRNFRCSEEIVRSMNEILGGHLPNIVPQNELPNILDSLFKEKDASYIITCFTNAMAEKLNLFTMAMQMDIDAMPYLSANNKDEALLVLSEKFLERYREMPCICKKQIVEEVVTDVGEKKYVQRFFTSERGIAHLQNDGSVIVVSKDVCGHHYEFVSIERFLWSFAPGFACTIYKAQGLEWDYSILWNDMNSFNRSSNACYVAYTRSRKKSIILSADAISGSPIEYKNIFRFVSAVKPSAVKDSKILQ